MDDQDARPYAAFRLSLEQQQKRAKDLLKAAKAADPGALRRLQSVGVASAGGVKLAQAQHCIARELRFASWADLKRHVGAMARSRAVLGAGVLDAGCRTMHIRCGHDIEHALRDAGFRGDFNAHTNPYLQGPVTDATDWLEQRARYIAEAAGPYLGVEYAAVLEGGRDEERRLVAASRDYERVVLWLEHDRYDQLALLRSLASFAEHGAPPRLELIGPSDFPGATRFVGLGQLPPEALCLLWQRRAPVSTEQIAFGARAWSAFRAADPSPLAELVRRGTPLLPDLAAALRRHLQELPSVRNGLGLTHELLLQALADHGTQPAGRLVGHVMHSDDPLPGLGDIGYDQALREMAVGSEPLVRRAGGHPPPAWSRDEVALTSSARSVLHGSRDWLQSTVPERWVGGVRIVGGQRNWRWDDAARSVVLT
ncbi:MAG TPA: DUF1835 domain-containing protein [Gammaproteobacteria bacterium]|nr:DUF1835 domain-containing protein [Gammaproteobacteria bacterium]